MLIVLPMWVMSVTFSYTGAKEKRLIPVLIDEDYRGKIPRSMSHITYLDYLRQDEKDFWKKLATSLGWKEHKNGCRKNNTI